MFWHFYPSFKLKKNRVLASHGTERGIAISPMPFKSSQSEMVHEHSCVIPMPGSSKGHVIEWSSGSEECHRHLVWLFVD